MVDPSPTTKECERIIHIALRDCNCSYRTIRHHDGSKLCEEVLSSSDNGLIYEPAKILEWSLHHNGNPRCQEIYSGFFQNPGTYSLVVIQTKKRPLEMAEELAHTLPRWIKNRASSSHQMYEIESLKLQHLTIRFGENCDEEDNYFPRCSSAIPFRYTGDREFLCSKIAQAFQEWLPDLEGLTAQPDYHLDQLIGAI